MFKRISHTFLAKVDELVGEIENHDALIKASIGEQTKKLSNAKIQWAKINSHMEELTEQIDEARRHESLWAERAVKEANNDENKALACLQRRHKTQDQIKQMQASMKEYEKTANKMSSDIARCETDLNAMKQKLEIMRARQSSSDALNAISFSGQSKLDDVQTSFDRWELKISQGELNVETPDIDSFEMSYVADEKEQALRDELAQLTRQANGE